MRRPLFLLLPAGLCALLWAPVLGPPSQQPAGSVPAGSLVPDDEHGNRGRAIEWRPAPEVPATGTLRRRPFGFVSSQRMLADLEELSVIGSEGLFRTSGSKGEREAFDWLERRLADLQFLRASGATLERQSFSIPLATEVRAASLALMLSGTEFSLPAHALQGHREDLSLALRYDSDGRPNDDDADPVTRTGDAVFLQRFPDLASLGPGALRGRIAFVDYSLMDRSYLGATGAAQSATTLLRAEPSAVVLVTRYSNARGSSHGSFVGDVSAFVGLSSPPSVPTVFVRLEDLAPAGIRDWSQLARVSAAAVTWDADVFSPATSEYLVLRIPGSDHSRAMILGAHLDSPNAPGAMDDGSGSVALLEAARALEAGRVTPPVDTVLIWFGSEERGLYGSAAFAQANSPLLTRAVAMLEMDCLTHPLDGLQADLVLEAQSYAALGDNRLPFPEALQRLAARNGVRLFVADVPGVSSDNSCFSGFGVPNADTIYLSAAMTEVHVEGHLHDPYDDMSLAVLHPVQLSAMATTALTAILDVPAEGLSYRVTPPASSRAVFVASHTEAVQMTPAYLSMLGMVLGWSGWSVEVVPYGTPVTESALSGAGMVFVLPVVDYPNALSGTGRYDEGFSAAEAQVLRRYVESGGFLILANSANRLRYGTSPLEPNEDWPDLNTVAAEFGISYQNRTLAGTQAPTYGNHPLVAGVAALWMAAGNGLSLSVSGGEALALQGSEVAAAIVPFGERHGEVLALADAAILGGSTPTAQNFLFWRNLGQYGQNRIGMTRTR